jgi:threonine/homoserine/homoserine lactone efflux protein
MPGPVLAVTITEASRIGLRAGPLIMVGHSLLELALFSLLVLGFVHFINHPVVLGVVGVAGGAVLLWMSCGMLKGLRTLDLDLEASGRSSTGPVLSGILSSLSNPYWIIWWATIGLGYVFWSMKFGWAGMLAFFTGHISADFAWYTLVSFLVWKGRKHIRPAVYRGVVAACAVVLIGFGIYFGISGLDYLI